MSDTDIHVTATLFTPYTYYVVPVPPPCQVAQDNLRCEVHLYGQPEGSIQQISLLNFFCQEILS